MTHPHLPHFLGSVAVAATAAAGNDAARCRRFLSRIARARTQLDGSSGFAWDASAKADVAFVSNGRLCLAISGTPSGFSAATEDAAPAAAADDEGLTETEARQQAARYI